MPRQGVDALDPEGVRTWLRGRVAHFKVPRHVFTVDALPMTVTGKVQKFRLQELAAGWLSGEAPAPAG